MAPEKMEIRPIQKVLCGNDVQAMERHDLCITWRGLRVKEEVSGLEPTSSGLG